MVHLEQIVMSSGKKSQSTSSIKWHISTILCLLEIVGHNTPRQFPPSPSTSNRPWTITGSYTTQLCTILVWILITLLPSILERFSTMVTLREFFFSLRLITSMRILSHYWFSGWILHIKEVACTIFCRKHYSKTNLAMSMSFTVSRLL